MWEVVCVCFPGTSKESRTGIAVPIRLHKYTADLKGKLWLIETLHALGSLG